MFHDVVSFYSKSLVSHMLNVSLGSSLI
jgi:hypothetical protein